MHVARVCVFFFTAHILFFCFFPFGQDSSLDRKGEREIVIYGPRQTQTWASAVSCQHMVCLLNQWATTMSAKRVSLFNCLPLLTTFPSISLAVSSLWLSAPVNKFHLFLNMHMYILKCITVVDLLYLACLYPKCMGLSALGDFSMVFWLSLPSFSLPDVVVLTAKWQRQNDGSSLMVTLYAKPCPNYSHKNVEQKFPQHRWSRLWRGV